MKELIIHNRVKNMRVVRGLSQTELAEAVGVTRQTISLIENDRYNPSIKLCLHIAATLDCSLNHLFWSEPS